MITDVPGSTRHGNTMHGPTLSYECSDHPGCTIVSRWDWPVPDDGDNVTAEQSDSEPVTIEGCAKCGREVDDEHRELLRSDGLL